MNKFVYPLLIVILMVSAGCHSYTTREKYIQKHAAELNDIEKEKILAGKLYIGMDKEAVLAAIGRPTRVNADFLGNQVTWLYDYDRNFGTRERNVFKTTFVVEFRDDKVFNWRED